MSRDWVSAFCSSCVAFSYRAIAAGGAMLIGGAPGTPAGDAPCGVAVAPGGGLPGSTTTRVPTLTVEESGVKGFEFVSWYGLWGPKSLPADVARKLQADIGKVLALPDFKQRLSTIGFEPKDAGGDQFAQYIRAEMTKYEQIIKDARIKVE